MSNKLSIIYNSKMVILGIAVLITVYLMFLVPWMNRWGVTETEALMSLPGDGVETGSVIASTRAVTINAPARDVWKWVVQLGQERAGFYSLDWLENLTLADIHNSNEIRSEWQSRQLGEAVLGAGGAIYKQSSAWHVRVYEEGKAIYLWGAIVVLPENEQTSRLLVRTYVSRTSLITQIINLFSFDWMHFVMERGMLLGIKARAEGTLNSNSIVQWLSYIGWITTTVIIAFFLFARRRGWWWGLIPLTYALSILVFTGDLWSAMAGFLWWGIIIAGFLLYGHKWWKGLALIIVFVVLVFVISPQAQISFGIIFLAPSLAGAWFVSKHQRE